MYDPMNVTIVNEATLKDGLYYLDPDCNEKPAKMRGQISGIITGIMAMTGCDFKSAVKAVLPFLPKFVRVVAFPPCWRVEFGIVYSELDQYEEAGMDYVWDTVNHRPQPWNEETNGPLQAGR
jgi:hypothetical protein